ncbi:MAG: CoA pyrophosphatase [Myxococcales bacterium]|nr:CoA pyrophosphatase [Myxococcales bacterium]HRC54463.1 CoA pyrophosphatase [Kofleriaceae bacterium]
MLTSLTSLPARLTDPGAVPAPLDGKRRAAVAVVLHGYDVLMMKRTERASDPWSGHVSLPGGRYEPADEHLLTTAIREAHEELHIKLERAHLLGSLPALHPISSGPLGMEVTPFVFSVPERLAVRTSAEAQAVFWLPLTEVVAGRLDGTYLHPESSMAFPSWQFDGYTVWGLTMRIVRDLIDRMRMA